jgi:hypothetical protein
MLECLREMPSLKELYKPESRVDPAHLRKLELPQEVPFSGSLPKDSLYIRPEPTVT